MRMQGWKTWAGGAGMILAGLGQCIMAIEWDSFNVDAEKFNAGVALIGLGLGAFGIGHKIEKASRAKNA